MGVFLIGFAILLADILNFQPDAPSAFSTIPLLGRRGRYWLVGVVLVLKITHLVRDII